ncbi:hypothetical protein O181_082401 [Austropuccinia psidii MF-1]|uniref:Integrase catalytic domain-containing protein n=1 Tax=Austropuccinia psidii MF-1 TaxID=1389203 RepID=A0A9Q3FM16_9BASI|nr:hypothetical protein [Austropuccinia psidii MF-1]
MATGTGIGIEIPAGDSSDEEFILKTKMIKLDTHNWVQWSCQMENYLTARRYDDLFTPPSEETKRSSKFRQKNSSALALLWGCVSSELEGVLLDNKTSFYDTWEALGNICGKNSIVTICETFYELISLKYEPESSLQAHIHSFQKLCARYNSITSDKELEATFPPKLLAATFIRSLNGDKELTGLVQTLYDIKPFTPAAVISRVAIEHSRRQPNEQALFAGSSNKPMQKIKLDDQKQRRRRNGKKYDRPGPSDKHDSDKRMENIERMLEKLQASMKPQSAHLTTESNIKTVSSDSDAFMVKEDMIFTVNDSNKIYLDSGAGKSVVNNLRYLSNCIAISHQINTYGNSVPITHQGTLTFKGIKISPVYYAPKGPVNLLSVSQLLDHNIKPVVKKDCFLLKQGQTIVAAFKREGNLFVSKLDVSNAFFTNSDERDWHSILGHPSDSYVKHLLVKNQIKGYFTTARDCEVCQLAKIKNRPHTRSLPSSNAAFQRLHIDTLQISPPTTQGIKYILVIVDDYSRFNRIYLMSKKDQAQDNVVSYLNELKNKILFKRGISLERGPPESPQTNGVAERFNQTLLSKIRCLLAQSKIPIQLWVEAAKHGSLLLNLLPHKAINMHSPQELLGKENMQIEPSIKIRSLIAFGMKTTVLTGDPKSKLTPRGETLKALTYESYSDGMRFYNEESKKIRISRDFQLPQMKSKPRVRQEIVALPTAVAETVISPVSGINADDITYDSVEEVPVQGQCTQEPIKNKHYDYVPYYSEAPRNISNQIDTRNILEEGRRATKPPERYMLADVVPYAKATTDPLERNHWNDAMKTEFESLMSHNTGTLVPYPKDSKVIGGMWRLTKKLNEYGEIYRYKARWVVLGNHQEHLLHYFDTWASVGRNESFKIMLSLIVNRKFIPYQFDVETAFLHGEMDTTVHVKQVKGFEVKGKESWVWKLNKSLYGTKQAPRMWQLKLTSILEKCGMFKSKSDDSLFLNKDLSLILHVHVDDGFIIGKDELLIQDFLSQISNEIKIKSKRNPTQHLGYMIVWHDDGSLSLGQSDLVKRLLHDNDMSESKGVKTPCNGNFHTEIDDEGEVVAITSFQQAIGSLNYLAQHTRPDIMFTVNQLSRYSVKPTVKHWTLIKHLMRYLKATISYSLLFTKQDIKQVCILEGWADADYANDRMDRKSISGILTSVFGNPISWLSKKQTVVAQSTTEAEFIAMNICAKQLRWMSFLLMEMGIKDSKPVLYNDNSGATIIARQAALNVNTKHIEVRYQYLRDIVSKKQLTIEQVGTEDMLADVLTKPLGVQKLLKLYPLLHLKEFRGVLRKESSFEADERIR